MKIITVHIVKIITVCFVKIITVCIVKKNFFVVYRPLDNLQNCLSTLRSEISGLQQQMDNHTSTIETSTNSWR